MAASTDECRQNVLLQLDFIIDYLWVSISEKSSLINHFTGRTNGATLIHRKRS